MYSSFFDELEKLALSRGGEGSRGGKVVGRTRSGKPVYESSKKKSKVTGKQRAAAATDLGLSVAGLVGLGLAGRAIGRAAGRAAGRAGASAGASVAGGAGRAVPKIEFTIGGKSSAAWKAARKRWEKASDAYKKAGGHKARGQKKVWDEYKKAGNEYMGNMWAPIRDSTHSAHKKYKRYQKASKAYEAVGGPHARGKGAEWREYTKAGDDYFGSQRQSAGWNYAKAKEHAAHQRYKSGRSTGGSQAGGAADAYVSPDTAKAAKSAVDMMPGLKNVKTKKDANKVWQAAMKKNHPDRGGDPAMAAKFNEAYNAYKKVHFSKLAMAHWSKLASVLFR